MCFPNKFLDLVLIKIDEPLTGKYIRPISIDSHWPIFELGHSGLELNTGLNGKKVTMYGWGLTEDKFESNQLLKQHVKIGGLEKTMLKLKHKRGHGACSGDSGGIHKKF